MIKAITNQTDLPDFEQIQLLGFSEPDVLLDALVIRVDLTAPQQIIYDECVALFNNDAYTNITNTVSELSITRITSLVINEEEENIDFETLDEVDKDKLRAFLALAIEFNTI